MRWLILISIFVAGILAVAGGSSDARPAGTVRVTLDEWLAETDVPTVRAGQVTFDTRNAGGIEHELQVLRTDAAPERLPVGLEGVFYEKAGELVLGEPHGHGDGGHDADGPSRHIAPGATRTDTVRLTPGRYVLFCNLPGHYAAGQHTALTVR